jgi:phosphatidylinositol alpha-1,6-mannosyltransferase
VDTDLFAPRGVCHSDRPTIVFTGRLVPNKGVYLLVDAACRLAQEFPQLRLRLLGSGEPKVVGELQSRACAAGRPDLLDVAGFVDRHELPGHLSQADVFAAPSRYKGGPGFVYLEAMACGLPVIGCTGSGAAEVIRHGYNGLLVPPADVDALTGALRELLANPGRRRALGEQARRFVLAEADSRACLKKLEAFYLSVVNGGSS